ncbi:hypothetical protein [Sphingomonas xinjiangensis]|uniref:DUF1579 domain-containing protein n=1 Tax=Sphingomonas xinjiangensis TaxID=643568 RepID=A0A840YJF2_9SPHN|nr:hypothetical protein [Sphingomonas xinjiangensis]MBB5711108.1 hypothetical protein [Sphingomonas xinjiangensis]
MLTPLAVLALIAADPAHAALTGLAGCWEAPGAVMGKPVRTRVRGSWRLGERYLMLEMHGLDPGDPYDAAVVMGHHDQTKLSGWWMDSFGAGYSTAGNGMVESGALRIDYRYPESTYRNVLTPEGQGWRWTIVEQKPGTPDKPFAAYTLTRSPCNGSEATF